MKKIFYIFTFAFLLIPLIASAHPGDLDSYNCHTCYTNCAAWGLSYGQYHCHNPKPPQYPCFIPKAYCSQTLLDSHYQYKQQTLTLCSRYGITEENCTDAQNWEQKIIQCKQDIQDYDAAMQAYNECEGKNDQLFKEWALLIIEQKTAPTEKTSNINCPANSVYSNGTCDCGFSYYNKTQNQCQSLQEYCVSTVGENGHFRSFSGKLPDITIQCECNEGYTKNDHGQCIKIEVKKCPENSSESNGKCFCDDGFTINDDRNGCTLIPKLEIPEPKIEEPPTEESAIIQQEKQPAKIPAVQQPTANTAIKNEAPQETTQVHLPTRSTTTAENTATVTTTQEETKSAVESDTTTKESFFIKITHKVKNTFINFLKRMKFW